MYLSVTPGRMKNIQKWMPNTKMTWKMTFPITVFLRYRARSTTMVPNWINTITRNASGTWSSDKDEVMSAAAECFCVCHMMWLDRKEYCHEFCHYSLIEAKCINKVVLH